MIKRTRIKRMIEEFFFLEQKKIRIDLDKEYSVYSIVLVGNGVSVTYIPCFLYNKYNHEYNMINTLIHAYYSLQDPILRKVKKIVHEKYVEEIKKERKR